MKQFTSIEQTSKLIKLGVLPKYISKRPISEEIKSFLVCEGFSIGELIEIMGYDLYSIHYKGLAWEVKSERVETSKSELIDALFDMIVKLKEEGVI